MQQHLFFDSSKFVFLSKPDFVLKKKKMENANFFYSYQFQWYLVLY